MKSWQKFTLVAGLSSLVAACGSRPEGVEASRQPSALALTLSISTPAGVAVDQAFLSGSNSLTVDDRVTLAQTGQLPAISGLGAGGVKLGSRVDAHSNVFSAGTTGLGSNMHVFGFVDSVGAIQPQNPIQIDHGTTAAAVAPLVTSFTVTFPASKSGDQLIGPDGPVVSLAPGYYSSLNLRSRGKVLLSAGNYYFDSFSLEPQAQFQVDSSHGATFIFVRDSFSHKSPITSGSSTPPLVVVGYLGSSLAYLQAGFPGVFMAPNATLELHRPDVGAYVGAFFAKDLHVFSDSAVGFSPFGFPLVCALGDKAHCDEDSTPDTDNDGPNDLMDGCPLDPNKIAPGICGCGKPETDRDHDKVRDCIDPCPDDPNNTIPGACGCVGEPSLQPAGVPCTVEACSGSGQQATCDGNGQCGVPACFPPEGCSFKIFRNSGYLICSGAVSWDQAEALCQQEPGRSLAEVDDRIENLWLSSVAGDNAWLGGNDRVTEGRWAWSYNGARNRRPFWDNGLPVPFHFVSWHAGAPTEGHCLKLGSDGTWSDANCAETRGFVCEQPLRRLPPDQPPVCPCRFFPGMSCDSCGQNDADSTTGPCVDGSSVFPNAHDENCTTDSPPEDCQNRAEAEQMVQDCMDNCKVEGDPGCDAHCTGFASVPPPGTCRRFSADEQLHCDLVPSTIVANVACSVASPTCPSGTTCGRVYDCAALDGNQEPITCSSDADCNGLHCDPRHRYCIDPDKKSNCDDKDASGKCVGACFGRYACGTPEPGCADRATDDLTGRCSTTEICADPGTADTDTDPLTNEDSNLTPSEFPSDDIFPENPPTPAPNDYPLAGPANCGGPGQATCDTVYTSATPGNVSTHPWCNYKVDPAETPSCGQNGPTEPGAPCKSVSDADEAFGDKKGASGSPDTGPIRFNFDPNLDISYNFGDPLPLGDTQFGAHAIASATADAHFSLFGISGDVSILDARGQVDVDRCGFNNDVKVDLFGIDLLPLVVDQDNLDKLKSANTSAEDRQACEDALGEIQKVVNRAQKALRDTQELIRQQKELVDNGQRFSPDLCHQLLEVPGKGVPADFPSASSPFTGCGALSPEDTINLFSRYYKQQVIALKAQVGDLLQKSAAKIPSINVGFLDQQAGAVADENRRETQQIANFNFAIGPIPMNLTIEAFVQYGVAGNLSFTLSPKAIADTIIANTNESLAEVNAAFTPFAGAGVSMFLGAGFDFGALSAKVGISGDVSLGVVSLPLYASAGINVQAANDERPLPADLQGMAKGGKMIYPEGPPRKFRFNAHYNFGIAADIKDILRGTIYGKLRIKFFWFSKTWQKKIAEFPSVFPEFKRTLIGGEGDAPFAFGDLGLLGFIHMPITFVEFKRVDTPPPLPPIDTGSGGGAGTGAGGGSAGGGAGSAGVSGQGGARVSLSVLGDPRYKDFDPSRVDQLFYAGYCECGGDGSACTNNLDCCGTSSCRQNDELDSKTCGACAHTSTFEHQGERCTSDPNAASSRGDCCGETDHCEPYGNVPPDASPRYCQVCVGEHRAMKTHNVSIVPDFPDECCPGLRQFNPPRFVNGMMTANAGAPICHSCEDEGDPCNIKGDCCGSLAECINFTCTTVK